MPTRNQTPEQIARDNIDAMLEQAGWKIQSKKKIDFSAGLGIAVREYVTDIGPADYVLFVNRQAVGVIEAKPENWGQKITTVEDQSQGYAGAELKWVKNNAPLPFVYESTGVITRFTNGYDPKPRSREIFTFHRPETLREWLTKPASLRGRLHNLPALDPVGLWGCQITAIKKLEDSFKENRPRALIQMATGSGKTYTAITSIYRLLKHADAKRVLFLVDTKNLGEQADQEFSAYMEANRDEIEALTIFYQTPQRRSELTYDMIREIFDKLKTDQPRLAPLRIWQAYTLLDDYKGKHPISELTALVALIRRTCGMDSTLSPYAHRAPKLPELDHDPPR